MRRAQNSSGTKGIMALEALIGTILSVVALVFLFQIFAWLLFDGETNLSIAIQNANSIVEFKQYSQEKYKDYSSCFTMLKLENLENYQIENNEADFNYYFYVITKEGIGIYNMKDFPLLREDYNNINNIKQSYFVEFEVDTLLHRENINLEIIKNYISDISSFFISNVEEVYNPINIIENNFIILRPKFNLELFDYEIWGTDDNQKKLIAYDSYNFNIDNWFENMYNEINKAFFYDTSYLIFEPQQGIFYAYSTRLQNYVEKNLCQYQHFANIKFTSLFKTNEELINFLFYDTIYGLKEINSNEIYLEINYKEEEIICNFYESSFENICNLLKNENIEEEKIQKYMFDIINLDPNYLNIETFNKKSIKTNEYIINNFLGRELFITDKKRKITIEDFDTFNYLWENQKSYFSFFGDDDNLIALSVNDPFVNCNNELCNYIIYDTRTGEIYRYNELIQNFVSTNTFYFTKDIINNGENYNLYLGNIEVSNFKIELFDKENDIIDDMVFFSFRIKNIENQEIYDVILSKIQIDMIRNRGNEE